MMRAGLLALLLALAAPGAGAAAEGLVARAAAKPHPRSLDLRALRANPAALEALRAAAGRDLQAPLPAEPAARLDEDPGERARQMLAIQRTSFDEEDRVLRLALAGLALDDARLVAAARRRALNLAGWSPRGATAHSFHDQAARSVAWTLALALDWLDGRWSAGERRQLLDAIGPRVADMLAPPVAGQPSGWAGLDRGRKLDRWPWDSHGAVTLARLAAICAILAGEGEVFDRCAEDVLPRYLARPVPWGETGGYANGTHYAQWDVLYTHFIVWSLLDEALGTRLWQSGWARGYRDFIAYFLPPGAPTGQFGDGAEDRNPNVWATQAKAYAARLPSPLADWYARNQFGENPAHLALLLSPPRDWTAVPGALPQGTAHAVHLADIGWVAMHGDLGDRARTSVYFKSSPYGSYNHSHADQNSFVVHARGRALAIDSGYYDYYGSPHWKDWYKQTRAHNAITFDGGQGQAHDTMAAKGRISRFETHAAYDIATGDATEAYGGALSRALRSIVYLRPDAALVIDSLVSATPRAWEWNLHALSPMSLAGTDSLELVQDGVRLCVTLLEAPPGAFAQTDRFDAEPNGKYPRQWHARHAARAKSPRAVYIALLDIECHRPPVELARHARGYTLALSGHRFDIDAEGRLAPVPARDGDARAHNGGASSGIMRGLEARARPEPGPRPAPPPSRTDR